VWRRNTIAAVVEPVGRNANWSFSECSVAAWLKARYRKDSTSVFSIILDRTEVIHIGRKSECDLAVLTLGTGRITAHFHCYGTSDVDKDELSSLASGLLK